MPIVHATTLYEYSIYLKQFFIPKYRRNKSPSSHGYEVAPLVSSDDNDDQQLEVSTMVELET